MIYRFKIWFDDVEDVVRVIDIKPGQTFLDFHNILHDSLGFDKGRGSFFESDDRWRKLQELALDAGNPYSEQAKDMSMAAIKNWVNDPYQRFIYICDPDANWTLFCELMSIVDEMVNKTYPLVFRTEGKAPKQKEDNHLRLIQDNEFEALAAKILQNKKQTNVMEGAEEEIVDAEDEEEDEEEEAESEFDSFGLDELNMDGFSETTEGQS